jgi:hypothetical protein
MRNLTAVVTDPQLLLRARIFAEPSSKRTPTEREARVALNDFISGLAVISERLIAQARTRHLVITLGAEGALINTMVDGQTQVRLPTSLQSVEGRLGRRPAAPCLSIGSGFKTRPSWWPMPTILPISSWRG